MLKDQQGSALILAISLVSLLAIVALGYSAFAVTEFEMGVNDLAQVQSSYLAEAGVNRLIWELRNYSIAECVDQNILKPDSANPNHFYFDANVLTNEQDALVISNSSGKLGKVSVELFKNQLDIVIKAVGQYEGPKENVEEPAAKKVIEVSVRNGSGGVEDKLENYQITSWREF